MEKRDQDHPTDIQAEQLGLDLSPSNPTARPQHISSVTSSFLSAQSSYFRLWGPTGKKGVGRCIPLKYLSIWLFPLLENKAGQAYLRD